MKDTAPSPVTLCVLQGPEEGRAFTFGERATCVVGRAGECRPRLPQSDRGAARHHCLIDINPPDVRLRDFDGRCETFVNGERVTCHPAGGGGTANAGAGFTERDLADGDEVRIGATLLRVRVAPAKAPPAPHHCAHCGAPVPDRHAGHARHGDLICLLCRARPLAVLRGLLRRCTPDDDLAGLRGHEVLRALGRGGRSAVFLARHGASGEQVALKMLVAQAAVGRRARAAVHREIEAAGALRHPNIAAFHHAGSFGGTFCVIGEYLPGGTLRDLLEARGGTLPPDEAVAVAVQVLDALAHAHAVRPPALSGSGTAAPDSAPRPLVHGDVKPSNILIADPAGDRPVRPGTVKIADFGLAGAFDRAGLAGLTRTGALGENVAYLPRTRIADHTPAGPETDVWGTAATLYRMLTGAPPRDAPRGTDPLVTLLTQPAVPVRHRAPTVPRRLARVVDAALIDSPRIVTTRADEFRRALVEAMR